MTQLCKSDRECEEGSAGEPEDRKAGLQQGPGEPADLDTQITPELQASPTTTHGWLVENDQLLLPNMEVSVFYDSSFSLKRTGAQTPPPPGTLSTTSKHPQRDAQGHPRGSRGDCGGDCGFGVSESSDKHLLTICDPGTLPNKTIPLSGSRGAGQRRPQGNTEMLLLGPRSPGTAGTAKTAGNQLPGPGGALRARARRARAKQLLLLQVGVGRFDRTQASRLPQAGWGSPTRLCLSF